MLLTTKIKLLPNAEQYQSLVRTMQVFNQACNQISELAFETKVFSKFKLQSLCYYDVKETFGLSSQLVIRAISKVTESYKATKENLHYFKPTGAIVYDQRILSFKGLNIASLSTVDSRIDIPMQISSYHQNQMQGKRIKGQADLILVDNTFYLLLVLDFPENTPIDTTDCLGIDLGIVNIATDSVGEYYSGAKLNNMRKRNKRLRKKLQSKSTKSAKKLLKKRRQKEQRIAKDINHQIAKKIVQKALRHNLAIVLEDLNGISKLKSKKQTVNKAQRSKLSGWSFYQLTSFIQYKALLKGISVLFVDPHYTSQQCSCCGHISKENRKTQSNFICESCNYVANADYNASLNIRAKGYSQLAERCKA